MCGISIVVDIKGDAPVRDLVERMNGTVAHRGPDASGLAVVDRVGLGHTRLAIIDLSEGGAQPMTRGGHHITFNGEIYNYRELRAELEAKGRSFSTDSDTEVLLVALVHWGIAAVDRLKGMFAFAWLDEAAGALYLARDRFGKKPLCYARSGGRLIAASEAKQILAVIEGKPRVNRRSALTYLEIGELNSSDDTFFENVISLGAGHYLHCDVASGTIEIKQWYDLSSRVVRHAVDYESARLRVRELLIAAVRRRHIADVEVGACLSGGIDSSAIVSLSATLFPEKRLSTISSYSLEAGYDERKFSRVVAERFSLNRIEICPDTSRIWQPEVLQEIGYYQDQPINGGSQYNEWCVFKAAREAGLIVMLDGQGSDEFFGGYGEFWMSAQIELLRRGKLNAFLAGAAARADAHGVPTRKILQRFVSSIIARRGSKETSRPAGLEGWLKLEPVSSRIGRDGRTTSFVDLSIEEMLRSSVPFQVHSEDRNSMRWSVESRLPFLDHDLVEYVIGLPTEYKCRRGRQKSILRDAVEELPPLIAQRKDKVGFASPDAVSCFQNAAAIRAALRDAISRLDEVVNGSVVLSAFDEMVKGAGRWYDPLFFRLIALDAWQEAFRCRS